MEHIEIEFKMLLDEKLFHQILKDYKKQITDSYQQTNYYLIIKIKSKTVINKPIIIFFILN